MASALGLAQILALAQFVALALAGQSHLLDNSSHSYRISSIPFLPNTHFHRKE